MSVRTGSQESVFCFMEGIMNFNELVEKYLVCCELQKGLDTKTIKAYRIDLRQYMEFCCSDNCTEKAIICDYIEHMHGQYKSKTIKRKIASLKAFFEYLSCEEIIEQNPFNKIHTKLKEPVILPKTISQRTLTKILNVAYNEMDNSNTDYAYKSAVRDVAVLELLFATGLRVSELCNLKAIDVNLTDNYSVKTFGKGGKERVIQLCTTDVVSILRNYKKLFKNEIENTGFFFVNKLSHRLSEQSVRFMINKYVNKVSSNIHITPHMFRHTFATMLLEADVDIRYIQHILGHSSITTTEIYTHVSSAKQRQILKRKHPRQKLSINKG